MTWWWHNYFFSISGLVSARFSTFYFTRSHHHAIPPLLIGRMPLIKGIGYAVKSIEKKVFFCLLFFFLLLLLFLTGTGSSSALHTKSCHYYHHRHHHHHHHNRYLLPLVIITLLRCITSFNCSQLKYEHIICFPAVQQATKNIGKEWQPEKLTHSLDIRSV